MKSGLFSVRAARRSIPTSLRTSDFLPGRPAVGPYRTWDLGLRTSDFELRTFCRTARLSAPTVLLTSYFLLCTLAAAHAADGAGNSREEFAASVREKLASERVLRSADGLVSVTTPVEISGADALTLIRFVGDVRRRLSQLLGTPLDDEAYSLQLLVSHVADGGSPGVDCWTLMGRPPPILRACVTGLDGVDPREVAAALCRGFLRVNAMKANWLDSEWAKPDKTLPDNPDRFRHLPYPKWFGTGCARLLDVSARQDDAESALARLEAGNLPPVAELLSMKGSAADADPALAAQLVAWVLDDTPRAVRFRELRQAIIDDVHGVWTPAAVLAIAAGTDDAAAADAAWRQWLADRRWAILTPGSSHPAFVKRLRGLLALAPPPEKPADETAKAPDAPDASSITSTTEHTESTESSAEDASGTMPPELAVQPDILARIPRAAFEENGGTILPEALVLHSDADWAPHAAMAMSGRLLRAAAGHGDDVLAAAKAYGEFFEAVKAREPRGDLARRLLDADALLQALEHRAAAE